MTAYVIFLIALYTAVCITDSVLVKVYTRIAGFNPNNKWLYLLLNAAFACVFFGFSAAWEITFDKTVVIYSLIYSVFVTLHVLINLIAITRANILTCSVFGSIGSIVIPAMVGICFFDEPLTVRIVLALLCLVFAAVLPFFTTKSKKKESFTTLLICTLSLVLGGVANSFTKLIAANEHARENDSSIFFLTNAFMFVALLVVTFIYYIKYRKEKAEPNPEKPAFPRFFFGFTAICFLIRAICTVASNISSLTEVKILTEIPVSVFSVISKSCYLIFLIPPSLFIFKEKITKSDIATLALAVAGIILCFA